MTEQEARFEQALALFRTREPALIERHVADRANAAIAHALMTDPAELERIEVVNLFAAYARSKGFSSAAELGWHWLARDEDELRDWQMEYLNKAGDALGNREGFLSLNQITRAKLGYRFRVSM